MRNKASETRIQRIRRHRRIRKKIRGSADSPRLCVFRSNKHIYAQLIDDDKGATLASASSQKLAGAAAQQGKIGRAKEVGKVVGEAAVKAGFKSVRFDRGGYLYHGRVAALAEGAREAGLDF